MTDTSKTANTVPPELRRETHALLAYHRSARGPASKHEASSPSGDGDRPDVLAYRPAVTTARISRLLVHDHVHVHTGPSVKGHGSASCRLVLYPKTDLAATDRSTKRPAAVRGAAFLVNKAPAHSTSSTTSRWVLRTAGLDDGQPRSPHRRPQRQPADRHTCNGGADVLPPSSLKHGFVGEIFTVNRSTALTPPQVSGA